MLMLMVVNIDQCAQHVLTCLFQHPLHMHDGTSGERPGGGFFAAVASLLLPRLLLSLSASGTQCAVPQLAKVNSTLPRDDRTDGGGELGKHALERFGLEFGARRPEMEMLWQRASASDSDFRVRAWV